MRKVLIIMMILLGVFLAIGCADTEDEAITVNENGEEVVDENGVDEEGIYGDEDVVEVDQEEIIGEEDEGEGLVPGQEEESPFGEEGVVPGEEEEEIINGEEEGVVGEEEGVV